MTVAVSCNLPDGVVLGVDSAITVAGPTGVTKVYENADKLFRLRQRPIGIAIYGLGSLGARSIESYLREFEVRNPDKVLLCCDSLEGIVESLRVFFLNKYREEIEPAIAQATGLPFDQIPREQIPELGLLVGGFSKRSYLSEVWNIVVPSQDAPNSAEPRRKAGNFGSDWFAMNEPILRYAKGVSLPLISQVLEYCSSLLGRPFTDDERRHLQGILAQHEYQVPFMAMPLKEGERYTRFLVEMVINHHRFVVGAPVVGGEARVIIVTPEYSDEPTGEDVSSLQIEKGAN